MRILFFNIPLTYKIICKIDGHLKLFFVLSDGGQSLGNHPCFANRNNCDLALFSQSWHLTSKDFQTCS